MTTQQKYDFVRNKIIEAVPEIMDLKFGCVLNGQGISDGIIIDRSKKATIIRVEVGDYKVEEIVKSDWLHTMRIDGRPITIEDVLVCLGMFAKLGHRYSITTVGHFFYKDEPVLYKGEIVYWTLGKNLSEQSPDLWEWLYEVLK